MSLLTSLRFPAQSRQPRIPASLDAETRTFLHAQQQANQQDWREIGNVLNNLSMVGTTTQRPAAGQAGRFYFATDTNKLFVDNGQAWVQIN